MNAMIYLYLRLVVAISAGVTWRPGKELLVRQVAAIISYSGEVPSLKLVLASLGESQGQTLT